MLKLKYTKKTNMSCNAQNTNAITQYSRGINRLRRRVTWTKAGDTDTHGGHRRRLELCPVPVRNSHSYASIAARCKKDVTLPFAPAAARDHDRHAHATDWLANWLTGDTGIVD